MTWYYYNMSNAKGRYSMKNSKEAVKRLSMIFAEYQIYPLSSYKENSPVRVFQRLGGTCKTKKALIKKQVSVC